MLVKLISKKLLDILIYRNLKENSIQIQTFQYSLSWGNPHETTILKITMNGLSLSAGIE